VENDSEDEDVEGEAGGGEGQRSAVGLRGGLVKVFDIIDNKEPPRYT
jgi:hypothetical protein